MLEKPIDPIEKPLQNYIRIPEPSSVPKTIQEVLSRNGPEDVMTLAKVDVPTYTQRLIDDLKRHEDEFRKK